MDNRRLVLLLIFFSSIALLWSDWQKQNLPAKPVAVTAAASVPTPTTPGTLQPPGQAAVTSQPAPTSAETLTIKTDMFNAQISTQGGDLTHLELIGHKDAEDNNKPFLLFGEGHHYAAQTGLIGQPGETAMPNHRSLFKALPGPRELAAGAEQLQVRLEASAADGIKVTKTLTFHRGSYLIDVAYEISNGSQKPLTPHAYFQLVRDDKAPAGDPRMVSTFTGPAVYTEQEKYRKLDFSDIAKGKAKFEQSHPDGWVAMVQHYYVSAWLPQGSSSREFYAKKLDNSEHSIFAAGLILPVAQIAPGAKAELSVPLFAGPQEQRLLEHPRQDVEAKGLDLVVDYGWLTIIAKPLFWVLEKLQGLVGNWGWAIVLLTVLLKLIFFPLSAASYKSMAKMRLVTPRLVQLKERYGDDRAKLNQEMMELYRKEKINPLGGCLPILVQIPVFIALYWTLLGAVEMRQAPWILWINDLSAADPFYVLPVIMVASMIIQTKLNPTPPDPIQAKVMMMMPFVFGAMFFFFPAGLVLYWVVNNILSIAQQWQITRIIEGGKPKAANDDKA